MRERLLKSWGFEKTSDVPRDSAFCGVSDEFDLKQLAERVYISRKKLY